jgi:hypothetical protein
MNSDAKSTLDKLIHTLNSADTLSYEARKLPPPDIVAGTNAPARSVVPVGRQKYYRQSTGEMSRVRVETSATVRGMDITTIYVKDENGVWEIFVDCIGEVSQVFKSDKLPGVFPFFRLFSVPEYSYELQLSTENSNGVEYQIVSGRLPEPPTDNSRDVAAECAYKLSLGDGRLYSIHERTFGKLALDLEFDKLELNPVLDPDLFQLPDKPKVILTSLDQFLDLRTQQMGKLLKTL